VVAVGRRFWGASFCANFIRTYSVVVPAGGRTRASHPARAGQDSLRVRSVAYISIAVRGSGQFAIPRGRASRDQADASDPSLSPFASSSGPIAGSPTRIARASSRNAWARSRNGTQCHRFGTFCAAQLARAGGSRPPAIGSRLASTHSRLPQADVRPPPSNSRPPDTGARRPVGRTRLPSIRSLHPHRRPTGRNSLQRPPRDRASSQVADSTFISNEGDRLSDEQRPSAREREIPRAEGNSLSPRRNDLEPARNSLRLRRHYQHLE
jgi:hypothetical protein